MSSAQPMTDHEAIRKWAEERGCQARVREGDGRE
jgi:hypothetical protein